MSFEEAEEAFYDEDAFIVSDPDHSIDEERFILVGMNRCADILVVSHCYRHKDVIRIISARKATRKEQKSYDRYRREGYDA